MELKQLEAFVAVVDYNSFSEGRPPSFSDPANSQRPCGFP